MTLVNDLHNLAELLAWQLVDILTKCVLFLKTVPGKKKKKKRQLVEGEKRGKARGGKLRNCTSSPWSSLGRCRQAPLPSLGVTWVKETQSYVQVSLEDAQARQEWKQQARPEGQRQRQWQRHLPWRGGACQELQREGRRQQEMLPQELGRGRGQASSSREVSSLASGREWRGRGQAQVRELECKQVGGQAPCSS